MPSRQHEQAKNNLFDHLQRKLSTCSWCAIGLRESHPRFHDGPAACEPEQLVVWTCQSVHGHVLDILAGAASVALERRHAMPDGSFCVPDITVLDPDEQPRAFIEVVHTHEPDRAVAVAGALDIPLFIVPAPGDPMARPPLQPEPLGVQTDEDRALFGSVQALYEATGSDTDWRFSYETVPDENGRQVPWRFSGSAPSFDDGYPLVGTAILAERCTWSCERASEAFEARNRRFGVEIRRPALPLIHRRRERERLRLGAPL